MDLSIEEKVIQKTYREILDRTVNFGKYTEEFGSEFTLGPKYAVALNSGTSAGDNANILAMLEVKK